MRVWRVRKVWLVRGGLGVGVVKSFEGYGFGGLVRKTQLYQQKYTHRPKRPKKGHRSPYITLGSIKACEALLGAFLACGEISVGIIGSSY